MKVLQDSLNAQTIRIIPRSYPTSLTFTLRDDQTNEVTTYAIGSGFTIENDYLVIQTVYTIEEYHFYDLTITDQDSNIIYKDRIFCTNQVIQNFTVNTDDSTWDSVDTNWDEYNQTWDGESEYIPQPSNNDYIII